MRAVDVIVGPGNVYVALAKREVAGIVGVPSAFAGPSEVVVVADDTTDPELAAVDVILQAEHGPGGLAWLITWSEAAADAITAEIEAQVAVAPRRDDITSTFASGGHAVVCDGPGAGRRGREPHRPRAPRAAHGRSPGAAAAHPSRRRHLLRAVGAGVGRRLRRRSEPRPAHRGTARFSGALTVRDFQKDMHVITLDEAALAKVAPHVEAIATAEGLAAHADSVRRRRGR